MSPATMTVNISQQQPFQHQDIHLKRKASESIENEQRLSKRFHRLNIHPDNARNHIPTIAAGTATSSPNHQHHTQNGYPAQPYQSPSVATSVTAATTTSPTTNTQYSLARQHNPNYHDIHTKSSIANPATSFLSSFPSSDPEAMQIEELPNNFITYNPSITDDESSSNAGTTSTTNTDDDDDDEGSMNNQARLDSNRRKARTRKDRVILIPMIDKRIDKIPEHVLRDKNRGNKSMLPTSSASSSSPSSSGTKNNTELVLYSDPSSLSVPRERDSVRKVILESRARARVGAANGARAKGRPGELLGMEMGNGMGAGVAAGAIAGHGTAALSGTSGTPANMPRSVPEAIAQDMQMEQQVGAGGTDRIAGLGGGGGGSSSSGDGSFVLGERMDTPMMMDDGGAGSSFPSLSAMAAGSSRSQAAAAPPPPPSTAAIPATTTTTIGTVPLATVPSSAPSLVTAGDSIGIGIATGANSSPAVALNNIDADAMEID